MSGEGRRRRAAWLTVVLVLVAGLPLLGALPGAAQNAQSASAEVQFVHAAPSIRAVDVYFDGTLALLGLRFNDVADPLIRPEGEHTVAVVPSGGSLDQAILDTTIAFPSGPSELAFFEGTDEAALAVLPLDLAPLPPALARLRFVNGAAAFGPADLSLTGGDLLFPSAEYGQATEFADLVAGGYDLDIEYGGTDAVALSLPGFTMEPERVYSLYVVGDANVGNVQTMVTVRPATSPDAAGWPAEIRRGSCAGVSEAETVADLATVGIPPFGEDVGYPDAPATASSFTSIGVPFADLLATTHSVAVRAASDEQASIVACGEIGGRLTADGSLVVSLSPAGEGGGHGVAVLAPNVFDPALTDLSLFVVVPPTELPPSTAGELAPIVPLASPAAD